LRRMRYGRPRDLEFYRPLRQPYCACRSDIPDPGPQRAGQQVLARRSRLKTAVRCHGGTGLCHVPEILASWMTCADRSHLPRGAVIELHPGAVARQQRRIPGLAVIGDVVGRHLSDYGRTAHDAGRRCLPSHRPLGASGIDDARTSAMACRLRSRSTARHGQSQRGRWRTPLRNALTRRSTPARFLCRPPALDGRMVPRSARTE
jgi:hypothetical protein